MSKTHQPLNRHVNKYTQAATAAAEDHAKPKERFTTKENFYHTVPQTQQETAQQPAASAEAQQPHTTDADVDVSTQASSAGATLPKRQKSSEGLENADDMGQLFASELGETRPTAESDDSEQAPSNK